MDIKYLSDPKGTITGVFIPLAEWERLQKQYGIQEPAATDSGQLRQQLTGALARRPPDDADKTAK